MNSVGQSGFELDLRISPRPIFMAVIATGILVGLLGGTPAGIAATLPLALALLGLGLSGLLVQDWRPAWSAHLACLGLTLTILLLVLGLHFPGGLILLGIPLLLGVNLYGGRGAVGFGLLLCVLIGAAWALRLGGVSAQTALTALLLQGGILAISLSVNQRSRAVTGWAWQRYQEANQMLEEARGQRAHLLTTMEDLAHSTQQLSLVNYKLASARMAAEEALKSKAMFVANVSHEFRTPLNMIIGLTDLLLETPEIYGERLPASLLQDLEIVRRNSEHLATMINDVLDLSQIEAGRLALQRERLNLAEIIRRAAAVVQPLLEKKHLDFRIEIAGDLPEVYCDRNRIRQVIVNLVSNAARFTESGSITVSARQNDQYVVVSVSDTGPGISPEDLPRLFQPFYQAENNPYVGKNTSGLGLTISRQFVELNSGQMWVESTLGQGSIFSFSLPVSAPLQLAGSPSGELVDGWEWLSRQEAAGLPLPRSRPTAVILDGLGEAGPYFSRYSEEMDFLQVRDAAGLAAALEKPEVEAVVVNAASPEALYHQLDDLRREGSLPDLPIFGCCLPPRADPARVLGALDYLVKPVTRAGLERVLELAAAPLECILIVDDNSDSFGLLERIVRLWDPGIRVERAESGQAALERMRAQPCDLVLLDLVLPDMSGWEVLARKNQQAELAHIGVVICSAQDPYAEPITSPVLVAASREGLSVARLLRSIQSLTRILAEGQ